MTFMTAGRLFSFRCLCCYAHHTSVCQLNLSWRIRKIPRNMRVRSEPVLISLTDGRVYVNFKIENNFTV